MSSEVQVHLSDVVRAQLQKGRHPREIRLELQKAGIPWRYRFATSGPNERFAEAMLAGELVGTAIPETRRVSLQGTREQVRRLRHAGLKRCVTPGCTETLSIRGRQDHDVCYECLEKKFGLNS